MNTHERQLFMIKYFRSIAFLLNIIYSSEKAASIAVCTCPFRRLLTVLLYEGRAVYSFKQYGGRLILN